MKRIRLSFLLLLGLLGSLAFVACEESEDETDGDVSDGDVSDGDTSDGDSSDDSEDGDTSDGDIQEDGDESLDGDNMEDGDVDGDDLSDGDGEEDGGYVSCNTAEAGRLLEDLELEEWQGRCRGTSPHYSEEASQSVLNDLCHPVVVMGYGNNPGFTNLVFCEAEYLGGSDVVVSAWPGPGYGLTWGPATSDIPTGWRSSYTPQSTEPLVDFGCTEAQNAALGDLAASRLTVDTTPCETITDMDQCLRTHNAPFHCMPVFTLPIVDNGDGTCAVKHHSEMTCAEHDTDVGLLACRQVVEPFDNPANRGDGTYCTGALKNSTTGECVGFSDYEIAIPDGWEKVDCTECLGE